MYSPQRPSQESELRARTLAQQRLRTRARWRACIVAVQFNKGQISERRMIVAARVLVAHCKVGPAARLLLLLIDICVSDRVRTEWGRTTIGTPKRHCRVSTTSVSTGRAVVTLVEGVIKESVCGYTLEILRV